MIEDHRKKLQVRFAQKEDLGRLADLCRVWAAEMNYIVSKEAIEDDLSRMVDCGVVIFIEDGEDILGLMSGTICYHFWTDERVAHEHWFFVNTKYRRMGFSRMLQNLFYEWAKKENCEAVIVTPNKFGSATPENIVEYLKAEGYDLHGYQMRKNICVTAEPLQQT